LYSATAARFSEDKDTPLSHDSDEGEVYLLLEGTAGAVLNDYFPRVALGESNRS
jgi:hypothetical protein